MIKLEYVPLKANIADLGTKPFHRLDFNAVRDLMMIAAQFRTAGESIEAINVKPPAPDHKYGKVNVVFHDLGYDEEEKH